MAAVEVDYDAFTPEEVGAIRRLEGVAESWPRSLVVFAHQGQLVIFRAVELRNAPLPGLPAAAVMVDLPCEGEF